MDREWEKDIDEIQIRTEKKQALKIMSEFVKYLKSHNIYCEEYPKDDIALNNGMDCIGIELNDSFCEYILSEREEK